MPEQVLNDSDVDPLFQEMGGKAVAQSVDRDALVQASSLDPRRHARCSERAVIGRAGSEPGMSQCCERVRFQ